MSRNWRWVWVIAAVGTLGAGLRLRDRTSKLAVVSSDASGEPVDLDGSELVCAPGCQIEDDEIRALVNYANSEGLDVIDVVPRSLRVDQALELLRRVDTATYRTNPLAEGESALQAILVAPGALAKVGVDEKTADDPVSFVNAAMRLKRHYSKTTDLVVAPGMKSEPADPAKRRAYLQRRFGQMWPMILLAPWIGYAFLAAGLVLFPLYGLIALGAWCLQPLAVFLGTPLAPDDLWKCSLLRWVLGPIDRARGVLGHWEAPEGSSGQPPMEQLRAEYAALLADGTDVFFEPRRDTCPMCGMNDIAPRISMGDMFQNKPGHFTIDECRSCNHLFQNPRLSLRGLDFYYRDFYEGTQAEEMDWALGASTRHYHDRSQFLTGHITPKRWIDIGTGLGHFCVFAKDEWPDTTFDGLDMAESIEDAERRGWVERGYRGQLLDIASELRGKYDVVSMFHYLEHTREPLEELDAAISMLTPGGFLAIELPDPETFFARILGRYWLPWFQPQHQHFLSLGRLTDSLEERGLTIVKVERGEAHARLEFFGAWFQLLHRVAPPVDAPWRDNMSVPARTARALAFTFMVPLAILAGITDTVTSPIVVKTGKGSDAYRVLAQAS